MQQATNLLVMTSYLELLKFHAVDQQSACLMGSHDYLEVQHLQNEQPCVDHCTIKDAFLFPFLDAFDRHSLS